MDEAPFDTLTLARHDPHGSPGFRRANAAPRAETLRQLRWQKRDCVCLLATHAPSTPCLIAPDNRAGLSNGLDVLQEAGAAKDHLDKSVKEVAT